MVKKKRYAEGIKSLSPKDPLKGIIQKMADCGTIDALNDDIIIPFITALESVCKARGYIINIYGKNSNLIISSPDDAESIYHLVEEYLDFSHNS